MRKRRPAKPEEILTLLNVFITGEHEEELTARIAKNEKEPNAEPLERDEEYVIAYALHSAAEILERWCYGSPEMKKAVVSEFFTGITKSDPGPGRKKK